MAFDAIKTGFRPAHGGTGVLKVLYAATRVMEERRRLANADQAMLDDLGLSRAQAEAEAARPVWDAPSRY